MEFKLHVYLTIKVVCESKKKIFQLPLSVDIIQHPVECESKSTAVHAPILAPDDVTMYKFPTIPTFDSDKVKIKTYTGILISLSYTCK